MVVAAAVAFAFSARWIIASCQFQGGGRGRGHNSSSFPKQLSRHFFYACQICSSLSSKGTYEYDLDNDKNMTMKTGRDF